MSSYEMPEKLYTVNAGELTDSRFACCKCLLMGESCQKYIVSAEITSTLLDNPAASL